MSSVAGRLGYAFRTPYAAAKWGVIGLTESLARELGPAGISVNAVLPGIVAGPRIEKVISARADQVGVSYDEMEKEYLAKTSLRRMVSADDVAAMVLFLASPWPQRLRPVAQRLRQRRDALTLNAEIQGNGRKHRGEVQQGHHHLRRDRRYPYAVDVAASAGDAGRDRRRRHQGGGSKPQSSICMPAIPKPASRTRRRKFPFPEGDQAAHRLRHQPDDRRCPMTVEERLRPAAG